jgi:hypothetical protein
MQYLRQLNKTLNGQQCSTKPVRHQPAGWLTSVFRMWIKNANALSLIAAVDFATVNKHHRLRIV